MDKIRIICKSPVCPCKARCCQDCGETDGCQNLCERFAFKEQIYSSTAFLVRQLEELAELSGHWLIRVAAQRLGALDLAAPSGQERERGMIQ